MSENIDRVIWDAIQSAWKQGWTRPVVWMLTLDIPKARSIHADLMQGQPINLGVYRGNPMLLTRFEDATGALARHGGVQVAAKMCQSKAANNWLVLPEDRGV